MKRTKTETTQTGTSKVFQIIIIAIAVAAIIAICLLNNVSFIERTDGVKVINDNVPNLSKTTEEFEEYSDLDMLGRCGVAYANISTKTMPTEKRESIGSVKPSGWQTVKYPDKIDGNYLYNRCHLIGYQLAGENANEKNLITGTRYLNTELMLPYENMIANYCKETGNHVVYRVTPVFSGVNLVADGVQMEALSVEDDKISFNVFCENIQPGIEINYLNGDSREAS